MIADLGTVVWKEWKDTLRRGGGHGKLVPWLFWGGFGVILPLQVGRAWVESPIVLAYWIWVPMALVSSAMADSFAGERERHTLETLLASRLSDRAILFGKIVAAVAYWLGVTWGSLLLGLATINLAHGHGSLLIYPPTVSLGIVVLGLLGAGLAAGAGVLVSLRAATVRQAQQICMIAIMLLPFVPVLGVRALPAEWKARLLEPFAAAGGTRLVVMAAVVLAVLDIGLLTGAAIRFRRARLILD